MAIAIHSERALAGLRLRPLSDTVGAEVCDLDIAPPLPEATIEALRTALDEYGVLLFRGQRLDPDAHIAFSERFGPLQEVAQKQYQMPGKPLIYIIGNVREGERQVGDPSVGRLWHSDQSFKPYPAFGSVLYGVECPSEGAETEFVSMYRAYDTLPVLTRRRVETLHAVHSFTDYYELLRDRDPTQPPLTDDRRAQYPDVTHPLVRRNPRTGRRALYVNPGYATAIVELPGSQGEGLLDDLCLHACDAAFVYAHSWQPGDVLVWDNLAVNHRGTPFDTDRYVRRMHRTTIASDQAAYEATLIA